MLKTKLKRAFKLSYAELNLLVNTKAKFALRDINEFAEYGYTTAKIQELIVSNQELANLPSDRQLEGTKMMLTEQKNTLVEQLGLAARKTLMVVSISNDIHSAFYRQFELGSLTNLNDAELIHKVSKLVAVSEKYQSQLETDGMTLKRIEELKNLQNQLISIITQRDLAEGEREITTERRVLLANKLYKDISNLCNIGKGIWINQSEAKYNNYLIHKTKTLNNTKN